MGKKKAVVTFLGINIAHIISARMIQCPVMECQSTRLSPGLCYQHDGSVPTLNIRVKDCNGDSDSNGMPKVCPFNLQNEEFAWVNENIQNQVVTDPDSELETSQIKNKKLRGYCKEVTAFRQQLNPGRDCTSSHQCLSKLCDEEVCSGLGLNSNCYSHSDCKEGLFCRTSMNWPFQSTCSTLKNSYESCMDDFECSISHYCWYDSGQSREEDNKKCLPLYSQDNGKVFGWYSSNSLAPSIDDHKQNGKYCKSALAYPISQYEGRCTTTKAVYFDGQEIEKPFSCSPQDTSKKCQIIFDVDSNDEDFSKDGERGYVDTDCKCSMSDTTSGFCDGIVGMDQNIKAVEAMQIVLDKSNCHTLDRHDMRAQKDSCGIGTDNEHWRFAVEKKFNMTYWPYIQTPSQYNCIQSLFEDSYTNLSLEQAIGGVYFNFALLMMVSTLTTLS